MACGRMGALMYKKVSAGKGAFLGFGAWSMFMTIPLNPQIDKEEIGSGI